MGFEAACAHLDGTSNMVGGEGDNHSTNLLAAETASLEEQLQDGEK